MLNLVAQGLWSESQVITATVPSSRPIIPEIEATIGQTWDEHQARLGSALFDGPMSRLESYSVKDGKLLLNLSETSYRIFLGTNLCHAELADKFARPALANAIGMSAALLTSDNKLVMGRRNDRVAYYPNRIHPFAGALEPRDVPNIFDGMRRELAEELNLESADVHGLHMLAIIEDRALLQSEFIFVARTSRTVAHLQESLDATEHRDLWSSDATMDALGKLLGHYDGHGRCEEAMFTPVAVGTILIFGQSVFGNDWIMASNKRFLPRQ